MAQWRAEEKVKDAWQLYPHPGDNTYSLSLHLSLRLKKGMASKLRSESPLASITALTLPSDNIRGNLILVYGLTYLVK